MIVTPGRLHPPRSHPLLRLWTERLRTIDRANNPPPGLRTFFIVALDNGRCLPVHPYIGEMLPMAGICPAQLTANIWISIIGFYSVCLLADVTPTVEFFLTSFL
ncbi:hypothetical protein LIER_34970 [Lithospermum erythrorhizon]|uniref:Uncharacterized protein n=1 Tax=Lithospermum erythrorhizon TaxID=34254 RepID=A0AAV3NKV8_LITER